MEEIQDFTKIRISIKYVKKFWKKSLLVILFENWIPHILKEISIGCQKCSKK